jgi:hypothetical protein
VVGALWFHVNYTERLNQPVFPPKQGNGRRLTATRLVRQSAVFVVPALCCGRCCRDVFEAVKHLLLPLREPLQIRGAMYRQANAATLEYWL